MATLGKLYARCKAAGGKSRGFGMTSVSSSPAISTMGTNNSLNSRSTFTRGLLSLKNSLYIPSYLSKTASAIETGRPLNTAKDYGSKYASAGYLR